MIKKMKKVQKIASLFARKKVSNKFRIIDIWKNEIDEKEFLIKLKSAQIIFSLIEIIVFISFAQKIFFEIFFNEVSRDMITHNTEDCENRVLMIKRSQR
jgi:hypothetical protein